MNISCRFRKDISLMMLLPLSLYDCIRWSSRSRTLPAAAANASGMLAERRTLPKTDGILSARDTGAISNDSNISIIESARPEVLSQGECYRSRTKPQNPGVNTMS
eukprot:GHVU01123853.1.p4 GENE.GHVU01123853.1~~GHVU01123853.1.p4  ORF type:complete len:105 (+),score=8.42 GHVU01123853.1:3091-3405(+)